MIAFLGLIQNEAHLSLSCVPLWSGTRCALAWCPHCPSAACFAQCWSVGIKSFRSHCLLQINDPAQWQCPSFHLRTLSSTILSTLPCFVQNHELYSCNQQYCGKMSPIIMKKNASTCLFLFIWTQLVKNVNLWYTIPSEQHKLAIGVSLSRMHHYLKTEIVLFKKANNLACRYWSSLYTRGWQPTPYPIPQNRPACRHIFFN